MALILALSFLVNGFLALKVASDHNKKLCEKPAIVQPAK